MSNLNKKLEQGDVVEILTSKNQTPKQTWLDKIFTAHARQKLMHRLNSNNQKKIWYNTTIDAVVAQLVEQLIRNEQVTGSNPANGSIFFLQSML